jgi:glycine dehydrogenase
MYELCDKDYGLCDGIIPLGSCTMKLNSAHELGFLLDNQLTDMHPFIPIDDAEGYKELIEIVGSQLKVLTGFDAVSFQPNSGATGEYAGLLCIKKYHEKNNGIKNDVKNGIKNGVKNEVKRNICLIPKSAHGTNFASAAVANLKVVKFDDNLLSDVKLFDEYVMKYKETLSCLMLTYPNTNGVFQKNIEKINEIIHEYGGLVYMDGANMNALAGIFNPCLAGFDICHLNLHKTFCIPHGGGGPGLGPILCNSKLADFLPMQYPENVTKDACGSVAASNWSSAVLLTIPYLYISCMGFEGIKRATEFAILNANYLKFSLEDDYIVNDKNEAGYVGHEFIVDVSEFKKIGITENDIAKRLMDYSFHPPTMSWPRGGVLMFEPTESESIEELDRLIEAMKQIRKEIRDIEEGKSDKNNNLLKNAPHVFEMICDWNFPYTPEEAFYPVESLRHKKFRVNSGRVDDLYGDKLLLDKVKKKKTR